MKLPFRLVAAPIAGISNRATREVMRQHGADAAYGEMVSARALAYGNKKTDELMDIAGEASPRVVQISGNDTRFVAQAAKYAVARGAEYIDLNMGCPAPKVVRNQEGSWLMQHPALAAELVRAAGEAGVPVSCKFRAGWDEASINAVQFGLLMQEAGAAFVAVHGRTRQQFYSGKADWQIISIVKQALSIPVIGNGDIFSAEDALAMLEQTGCDGIMVGRGMLGNPWLFADIQAALLGKQPPGKPPEEEILQQALQHLKRHIQRAELWYCQREGESAANRAAAQELAVRAMRGHLGWYTKGIRNSAGMRLQINRATSFEQVADLLKQCLLMDKQEQ